jgi:hypothetical protein
MSNCLRCETLDTTTEPEFLVRVKEFLHPVYGWMKSENAAVKVCKICLLYTQSVNGIKVEFKEIEK